MASGEIDEHLLPTERRVIRVRKHWAVMTRDLVATGLFLLVMIVLQTYLPKSAVVDNVTFYLALSAVLRFTLLTFLWWIERIVVTDKRVMLAEGIITQKVGMMPLSKVTDLTFERTLDGRMLGYGTIIVESAGQIQALNRIVYVPHPEEVYEALSELIFGEKGRTPRRGSGPGGGFVGGLTGLGSLSGGGSPGGGGPGGGGPDDGSPGAGGLGLARSGNLPRPRRRR